MKGSRPIELRGASEHNLAALDVDLPWGQWIAVTGPSGSGKTSLVFDTLVREGRRRYLGSLAAGGRQRLGKLGRARITSLRGLPVPHAVGHVTGGTARSTVGTRSGVLDLLRLVFARTAVDPGGVGLTRGHFSFNAAPGACETCRGLGVEDQVDPALLIADASKSIRRGALVPTLPSGYTVYSQVTVEVMDTICRAHGFDVDTPWQDLTSAQQDVVLYGTRALKVPFGKHSIESRMKWEGITARPREEGFYRGLVPVIEETLARNRNANILRFVRSIACRTCHGTRLSRPGREAHIRGQTLPALLALPLTSLGEAFDDTLHGVVWDAVRPSILERIDRLCTLSLGHLSLGRPLPSLSGGEAGRLAVASVLSAGLSGMLIALDEPTLGLHPSASDGMKTMLDTIRDAGNTLVVVDHDPQTVRFADHVIALGPGAGTSGGRLVPVDDWEHPLGPSPLPTPRTRRARGRLELFGATLHNLQDASLTVELGCFNVVLGPSGAGKSSLVFGTLLPALLGQRGGPYQALRGRERVAAVDARPLGRTPRSTPATWTGLFDRVRRSFAATAEAKTAGLGASAFSYNTKTGRCPACEGLGVERVGLHLLEDAVRPCPVCGGGRYAETILGVRLRGKTIADVLQLTIDEAVDYFADDPVEHALCAAMQTLGLGYLELGHGSHQLSRGEAQRIKLATLLGRVDAEPSLLLLDEPDRGLHPDDIRRLLGAIDALVDAGHTVLAVSHHHHVWAAADVRIEVVDGTTTHGAPYTPPHTLARRPPRPPAPPPSRISLRGVTTNNLQNVSVDLPHHALTVVAGVSGSGKSSLVWGTLAAEAWHRFSETLPFTVRSRVHQQPRPELDAAEGLTPVVSLRQSTKAPHRRSTVATQSELGPLLRLLWARAGSTQGLTAEHFSSDRPLGACPSCAGLGTRRVCTERRLITDPNAPVSAGAMAGTKPGRFFSAKEDQHVATLRAALRARGLSDDLEPRWVDLPPQVRTIALHGTGEQRFSVTWSYKRGKREGTHTFEGPWSGFLALVEREAERRANRKDADAWHAPLEDRACEACGGSGLRPEVARVDVGGLRLSALNDLPIHTVLATLDQLDLSGSAASAYAALRPELAQRLQALCALRLGHLSLRRRAPTLSAGELQRLRLAGVLHSGLTNTTIVLDEPDAGLHDNDVALLIGQLVALRNAGNTVVVVSHRAAMLRAADHVVELGPGAGPFGGHIVAQGSPAQVLRGSTTTARALRETRQRDAGPRRAPTGVRIRGAHARGLPNLDLTLPAHGVVEIRGPSGSGKSTLLFDVIEASARSNAPRGCRSAEGFEHFKTIRSARGSRGRTVLTTLGAGLAVQQLFSAVSDLPKAAFAQGSARGRCEVCKGRGFERIAMDALADIDVPCSACDGTGFRPEVRAVRWRGRTIADVLACPVQLLGPDLSGHLRAAVNALVDVGLGHVSLGRSLQSLSGGEAQRVLLASRQLGTEGPALIVLDDPSIGLHAADLHMLYALFVRLADAGDLIVFADHRTEGSVPWDVITLQRSPQSDLLA